MIGSMLLAAALIGLPGKTEMVSIVYADADPSLSHSGNAVAIQYSWTNQDSSYGYDVLYGIRDGSTGVLYFDTTGHAATVQRYASVNFVLSSYDPSTSLWFSWAYSWDQYDPGTYGDGAWASGGTSSALSPPSNPGPPPAGPTDPPNDPMPDAPAGPVMPA